MPRKMILFIGILSVSLLCAVTHAEQKEDVSSTSPPRILFEGRVIEVKDTGFFKRLGLKVSYDSAGAGSLIREKDFDKVLKELQVKDNSAATLLSYVTTTTVSGRQTSAQETVTFPYLSEETTVNERVIGASFMFTPSADSQSSIIAMDIRATYGHLKDWEQGPTGLRVPIIANTTAATALSFNSGDTIILGGSSDNGAYQEDANGHILFLVTMKIQERAIQGTHTKPVQPEKTGPRQILFETRVIEVKDRGFFKRLGLNISYDSAGGGSLIRERDLEKVLKELQIRDNPAIKLLSYGTTTTVDGQTAIVQDTTQVNYYTIKKNGHFDRSEEIVGASFEFSTPVVEEDSSIVTESIVAQYSRLIDWAEFEAGDMLYKYPIVSATRVNTALSFDSGDTILLGGSGDYPKVGKTHSEGHILFLITVRLQERAPREK